MIIKLRSVLLFVVSMVSGKLHTSLDWGHHIRWTNKGSHYLVHIVTKYILLGSFKRFKRKATTASKSLFTLKHFSLKHENYSTAFSGSPNIGISLNNREYMKSTRDRKFRRLEEKNVKYNTIQKKMVSLLELTFFLNAKRQLFF